MKSRITFSLVLMVVLLSVAPALAQENQPSAVREATWIQDSHVIVVVPANRTAVSAYSLEQNVWSRITFDSPLSPDVKPIVSQGMVALKDGHTVYCFSANTGAWDNVTLEMGSNAVPTVQSNCITLKDGDSFYVFGVNSEVWSGVDLQAGDSLKIKRVSGEQSDEPKSR